MLNLSEKKREKRNGSQDIREIKKSNKKENNTEKPQFEKQTKRFVFQHLRKYISHILPLCVLVVVVVVLNLIFIVLIKWAITLHILFLALPLFLSLICFSLSLSLYCYELRTWWRHKQTHIYICPTRVEL